MSCNQDCSENDDCNPECESLDECDFDPDCDSLGEFLANLTFGIIGGIIAAGLVCCLLILGVGICICYCIIKANRPQEVVVQALSDVPAVIGKDDIATAEYIPSV